MVLNSSNNLWPYCCTQIRDAPDLVSGRIVNYFTIWLDNFYYSAGYRIVFFLKSMRKYTGKPLPIVLYTIFLRRFCKRVISPKELTQFSQTKWWPKLKGVSIMVTIIRQFIFQKEKFQKWSQFSNHLTTPTF